MPSAFKYIYTNYKLAIQEDIPMYNENINMNFKKQLNYLSKKSLIVKVDQRLE